MLLRNISVKEGLCNGTRLIVRRLHRNLVEANILLGRFAGKTVFFPRIDLAPSDTDLPFVLKRRQFPLRLAWSMTINKAQGQTFKKVGLYLDRPVFAHGQLYVAFSRARALTDVHVHVVPSQRQGNQAGCTFTQNIVYKEIL